MLKLDFKISVTLLLGIITFCAILIVLVTFFQSAIKKCLLSTKHVPGIVFIVETQVFKTDSLLSWSTRSSDLY